MATLHEADMEQAKFSALTTHETLFAMAYDGEWEPRLLDGFDVSPEGLTYTLYLKRGVHWHANSGDWGQFNAQDFLWSIDEVTRPGSSHPQAANARQMFTCERCTLSVIDDYTIELKRPEPTFKLTWYSQSPLSSFSMHSLKHYAEMDRERATEESVGTGPWEMIEHETGKFRRMRAVEGHWRKTPEFAEMVWWDMPEEATRLASFLTGKLDTGMFNLKSIQTMKTPEHLYNLKFVVLPRAAVHTLWHEGGRYFPDSPYDRPNADSGTGKTQVNGETSDFRDICELRPWISCNRDVNSPGWERARKVREAMAMAIDSLWLVNNISVGEGEPWYVSMWGNWARVKQFGFDELFGERQILDNTCSSWGRISQCPPEFFSPSRKLLYEAGYSDGFDVAIEVPQEDSSFVLAVEAVAEMWEELGLNVEIRTAPERGYARSMRDSIDISGRSAPPPFPEPISGYGMGYHSSSPVMYGTNHPELDRLIELAENTYDNEERWRVQADLARFIFDNVLAMPLYAENTIWPLGPELDYWSVAPAELDWLNNWEYARVRR